MPIDSVEALNVYQAPYLAEFGRFSAGLVTVETRRGGEQWKWELNDPLPEFRIRSHHLRGLKTATPRLNFEGPLIARKLYVSEGMEYEIRKTAVYTLPFPRNQKRQEGVNSFTQLDWIQSERHLVTGTAHIAPQRLGHVNMDYFNPEETTPDASTHNYTGTLTDRLTLLRRTAGDDLFDDAVRRRRVAEGSRRTGDDAGGKLRPLLRAAVARSRPVQRPVDLRFRAGQPARRSQF